MIMEIASYIDHTLLKPTAVDSDIRQLCLESVEYGFLSVCVNSCRVPLAAKCLEGSGVKVCAVTGFPLGAMSTAAKFAETEWCLKNGADEIDTVINIGMLKEGNRAYVEDELSGLAELVHSGGGILKVIFENCLLEKSEIVDACRISVASGVDFVKTSTGFSHGGATVDDVKLMLDTVDGMCCVKAAGGIRTREDAVQMIELGVKRIGTSSGIAIVQGLVPEKGKGY